MICNDLDESEEAKNGVEGEIGPTVGYKVGPGRGKGAKPNRLNMNILHTTHTTHSTHSTLATHSTHHIQRLYL